MPDEAGLRKAIRNSGKLLVAFSGGLDSTVIARLAADELGANAVVVTVDSETIPRSELAACATLVKEIGIRHIIVKRKDLEDEDYRKNPADRCYFCRKGIAGLLRQVAVENDIKSIADGANLDDLDDYRPGLKAFKEAGIWHPFIDFGFTKSDIRDLGRKLDLSVKEKPSQACLASRISYNEEITVEKLRRVEEAETFIRDLGFSQVRVRYLKNDQGKIEVLKAELDRLLDPAVRVKVIEKLKDLGFSSVTVDLEGYRTGSMNIGIKDDK